MLYRNILNFGSFYFVGIGGVSMSALAEYLILQGKRVGGCDAARGGYVQRLEKMGAEITFGDAVDIKNYEAVVYTDAIPDGNGTLSAARLQGKAVIPRGEFLAAAASAFGSVVAVAGCHGKTTCTSMLAHIFDASGMAFASHIGGNDIKFGNFYMTGCDYFITEACEYRKNFLRLEPDVAVVLNSAADHMECYGSVDELKKCYARFLSKAKSAVALYGDLDCGGVTFGFDRRADFSAKNIRSKGGKYSFMLCKNGENIARIGLSVYGKHNVLNALAAYAAADACKIPNDKIVEGLEKFGGVGRRFEYIGTCRGAVCIADYAHHPDEIRATLKTAREITSGKLYVVFQPHTYSRTKNLFSRFVAVLAPVKRLMIYKTFAAREYYDDGGSAYTLSLALKKSRYGDTERDIIKFLSDVKEGDAVLFLGAGDIYDIAVKLVKNQC